MSDIITIEKDGRTYAKFFRKGISADGGVKFLTEPTEPLQVGLIEYEAGSGAEPHTHSDGPYDVRSFSEFIYVQEGKILVRVLDDDFSEIASEELSAGDFLLFMSGGHSVEAIESCKLIEVKQGPYPGDEAAKNYPE